jgi:hypothetical protein
MNLLLRMIIYVGIGSFLIISNVWYIRSIVNEFSNKKSNIIAPFSILGKEDKDGSYGTYLAEMLIAEIGEIKQQMKISQTALEIAKQPISSSQIRRQDTINIPLSIPEEIFDPLDLELTLGGVEIGGIISWLYNSLSTKKILKFSVHYQDDRATLIGTINSNNNLRIYLKNLKPKNEEIISSAAYIITQREFSKNFSEVDNLDVVEFRLLLNTLHKAAQLEQQITLGRIVNKEYKELLLAMEKIAKKIPRWKPLLHLTGEIAEKSSLIDKAIKYYEMELKETDPKDNTYQPLSLKITTLKNQIASSVKITNNLPAQPISSQKFLEKLRNSDAGKSILKLVNASFFNMKNQPTIAVLGGIPSKNVVPEEQTKILPISNPAQQADAFMSEYIGTVIQTIRLIAPDCNFIFQSMFTDSGGVSTSEMIRSIDALINASPDIILITFGPIDSSLYEKLFQKAINQGILVIIVAGNDGPNREIHNLPIFEKLMIVSATDKLGNPAPFTQKTQSSFWAPGVDIPVYLEQNGKIVVSNRKGTTYSAAIAAAIAARLLAEEPDLSLTSLLARLKNTSRVIVPPNGPPVLNLNGALKVE